MKSLAFAYLRVSGLDQVSGDGFTRQEKAIKAYARSNGYKIAEIFRDEGVSGTLADRPALAEMLVSLESNGHGIKTVIIEMIERLSRDQMLLELILNDFRKMGVAVLSATEGDLIDNDPTPKLMRTILGGVAEYNKTMLVLKLRAARDRIRKKTGKCEGRRGYSEPANADIIKHIREFSRVRRTSDWIADWLNDNGFKPLSKEAFNSHIVRNIRLKL